MTKLNFPKNFYWGTSTSAYQVEGGIKNNWSSVFDAGMACDHYNRFREDFDSAKELGQNAHRFSIEWARIEPEEGKFDEKEIEHYREVIQALRERDLEPFVTLWHWTIPVWLQKKDGLKNKKFSFYFSRFTERIVKELSRDVLFWITLNEPLIYASNAYLKGIWPPQKSSLYHYIDIVRVLKMAHMEAYTLIKKINPEAQIGIAKNNIYFDGEGINALLQYAADWWWNFRFLNHIKNHQDFIGLNYYFHSRIRGLRFNQNENNVTSDMGWEIYPEGIYHVLEDLCKYKKPIYIMENGIADAKDEKRAAFIRDHLRWVHKAIENGVDVRGYFYWSLLDNFEWNKGFWPRFGLIEVNYKTMRRKIRPSAWKYKEIIKG